MRQGVSSAPEICLQHVQRLGVRGCSWQVPGDLWFLAWCQHPSTGQHVWGEGSHQARAVSLPCFSLLRFLVIKNRVAQRVFNLFLGKSKEEEHSGVFFLRCVLVLNFYHRYTVTRLLLHQSYFQITERNTNICIAGEGKRCLMGRMGVISSNQIEKRAGLILWQQNSS